MVPVVPPLAPLLARMTTHIVEERFSASESLQFYHSHLGSLPEDVLSRDAVIRTGFEPVNDPNIYWQLLSPEYQDRWSHYRVPPRSLRLKFLLWITSFRYGWEIVHFFRRTFQI